MLMLGYYFIGQLLGIFKIKRSGKSEKYMYSH